MLRLYNVPCDSLLRYILLVLCRMTRANVKELENPQAQALRACIGLPRTTWNFGSAVEARLFPIGVSRTIETFPLHLPRHVTQHSHHHLSDIARNRAVFGFIRNSQLLRGEHHLDFEPAALPSSTPWQYARLNTFLGVARIISKNLYSKRCSTSTSCESFRSDMSSKYMYTSMVPPRSG